MTILSEGYSSEGEFYPMLSLLPGKVKLGNNLRSLGYCEVEMKQSNILGERGVSAKGHLFHWASIEHESEQEFALSVFKSGEERSEGSVKNNILGSWVHFHFASNPSLAESFVRCASEFNKS